MRATPGVGLHCFSSVVEGHTGANNINHSSTFLADSSFKDFFHLLHIARKSACHKSGATNQGFHTQIKRWQNVFALVFQNQSLI